MTSPEKYFRLINDPTRTCKDFRIISDSVILVEWEDKQDFMKDNMVSSEIHAAMTTSLARLKLMDLLLRLDRRVIYYDTGNNCAQLCNFLWQNLGWGSPFIHIMSDFISDLISFCFHFPDSVIFTWKKGQWMPEIGDYLGMLTNEVDAGDHILEIVCTGPKQYAFRTFKGKKVCKLRGFTLNCKHSQAVNFDALRDFVFNIQPFRDTTLRNPSNIVRNKMDFEIVNRPLAKHYKPVFTKRRIDPENRVLTYPYGF